MRVSDLLITPYLYLIPCFFLILDYPISNNLCYTCAFKHTCEFFCWWAFLKCQSSFMLMIISQSPSHSTSPLLVFDHIPVISENGLLSALCSVSLHTFHMQSCLFQLIDLPPLCSFVLKALLPWHIDFVDSRFAKSSSSSVTMVKHLPFQSILDPLQSTTSKYNTMAPR